MKTYLVGGAVRDKLLGLPIHDRDYVVTGATSQDMLDLGFKNVGRDFPVFLEPRTNEEYALARKERKTGSGHTAFSVDFNSSVTLEEDLARRDLTICSMAMDLETGEIIDPFNGQSDIENKILRHTSDAFSEDPLRVVRLARFYARFGDFKIDTETFDLAKKLVESGELNSISTERFWAELKKVFDNPGAGKFMLAMWKFGAFKYVKFFNDIFGDVSEGQLGMLIYRANMCKLGLNLNSFVALSARNGCLLDAPGIPTVVSYLRSYLKLNTKGISERTAVDMRKLITFYHGWQPGQAFTDFIKMLETLDYYDPNTQRVFTAKEIKLAIKASGCVNASWCPSLKGIDISEFIKSARTKIIAAVLEIPYE